MDDLGPPIAYLELPTDIPVYSSDGQEIGRVAHVLADDATGIFDGIVVNASGGGHRFADAPDIAELHERGVVLALDSAAAQNLHEPTENPPVIDATPDDASESALGHRLRRAWDWISGNY